MDEDFESLALECNNCHLQFFASELRTDPMTNSLMCVNCLGQPNSKINVIKDRPLQQKKPAFVELKNIKQAMPGYKGQPDVDGLITYRCDNCRYTLKRKSNYNGNCPYCNHSTLKIKSD